MNENKDELKSIFKDGWISTLGKTKCGDGSEGKFALAITMTMELIIKKLDIKTVADVGCGDLNIGSTIIPFIDEYYGYDLHNWGEKWILSDEFSKIENKKIVLKSDFSAVHEIIKPVDIIFCNNLLLHYPNEHVLTILDNFKKSGSKFLWCWDNEPDLNTNIRNNINSPSKTGHGAFNLSLPPFNLINTEQILTDSKDLLPNFFYITSPYRKIIIHRINQ